MSEPFCSAAGRETDPALPAVLIIEFPDKATFLTPEQIAMVQQRIEDDRGDSVADHLNWTKAKAYLADFKLWVFGLLFMCSTMPAYAFAYFLPVILAGGGYSVELSLILSAPPYVFGAIYTFAVSPPPCFFARRAAY